MERINMEKSMRLRWALLSVLCVAPTVAGAQVTTGMTADSIYYESSGSGDAIVLIHAFSVDRRMWAPQIDALEDRFRVIRYDLRGHGESGGPSSPYAAHEDLRSVLDALGIERATLIGLSAGAAVAIDFAITYPDRVERIVLASPGVSGYVPSTPLDWMQPVFQAAGSGDAPRAASLWAATPIMVLRNDTSAATGVRRLIDDNVRLWTYRSNQVRSLTPPAIQRLAEIRSPALVILGEQDLPHIADVARLLADGIPDAKLITIPRAGHIVNLDAPIEFDRAIGAFLTDRRD